MSDDETGGVERSLGLLFGQMQGLGQQLSQVQANIKEADEKSDKSRANVHRRLDDINTRTSHLESGMQTLANEVGDMRSVTDDVKKMREQAQGAGTLGQWLIRIGGGVLAVAGWMIGVYTYLTGKPPP